MKQTLLHKGINAAVCMLLMGMLVISINCIELPSEPVAPTFDTQVNIPVLDTTQYFSEFAKKTSVFQFDPADSTYSIIFTKGPNPIDTISNLPRQVALGESGVKGFSKTLKNISAIDGTMNFEFTNRIPITMSLQLRFLKWDSAGTHSDTLLEISKDSVIKAPAVDINGFAINPRISNVAMIFTGEQIDIIPQADSIFVKLFFNLGNELKSVKFK